MFYSQDFNLPIQVFVCVQQLNIVQYIEMSDNKIAVVVTIVIVIITLMYPS